MSWSLTSKLHKTLPPFELAARRFLVYLSPINPGIDPHWDSPVLLQVWGEGAMRPRSSLPPGLCRLSGGTASTILASHPHTISSWTLGYTKARLAGTDIKLYTLKVTQRFGCTALNWVKIKEKINLFVWCCFSCVVCLVSCACCRVPDVVCLVCLVPYSPSFLKEHSPWWSFILLTGPLWEQPAPAYWHATSVPSHLGEISAHTPLTLIWSILTCIPKTKDDQHTLVLSWAKYNPFCWITEMANLWLKQELI